MPAPVTVDELLSLVRRSGLAEDERLDSYVESLRAAAALPETPRDLAAALIRDGMLTQWQTGQLLQGKSRGFVINGKFKVLEHLGTGGMGMVYLCEHTSLHRLVAVKVLPLNKVADASSLERFYREARAVAALDHPNIVRAYDVDCDGKLHYIVMEYVDGSSLQQIVSAHGRLDVVRTCHYMSQAAWGLQHAHEGGLVHRDIKPANLLVDRGGTVKILDLGLARLIHDDDNLSKRYDETVLGTSDYLAPEQALDSKVDIRADIYSLGATFYFCLTGQTLFPKGMAAQKLMWQQVRQPTAIRSLRPEVPEELAAIIEQKMLAKQAEDRFQTPVEVCEALAPWIETPILPPPEEEMPKLSPAALRAGDTGQGSATAVPPPTSLRQGKSSSATGTPSRRPGTASPSPVPRPVLTLSKVQQAIAPGSGRKASAAIQSASPTPAAASRTTEVEAPTVEVPPAPLAADIVAEAGPPAPSVAVKKPKPRGRGLLVGILMAIPLLGLVAFGAAAIWWTLTASRLPPVSQGNEPPGARPKVERRPPPKEGKAEAVTIRSKAGQRVIHTAAYEAALGNDGNLASLKVGGTEFLKTGVKFGKGPPARGSYFFHTKEGGPGVVPLSTIEQPAKYTLKAVGDKFTVGYEFRPDSIILTLTNATDHTVPFHLVFDPGVTAVRNEQGETARLPATRYWQTTSWFAGKSRLTVTNGSKIWGPWVGGLEVWEAGLKTYETRTIVLTAGTASDAETTAVAQAAAGGSAYRFQSPAYEAVVEDDGCMTSLRMEGVEFLKPGVDISRGVYFHTGKGVVKTPQLEQPDKDVLVAKGPQASVRYEFHPSSINCTASNTSDQPLNFYMVFDPAVVALQDGEGGWAKTPLDSKAAGLGAKKLQTTTWFTGPAKLKVMGGNRVWGPWTASKLQVWEARLNPREVRKIVLTPGAATKGEAAKVAAVSGTPAASVALTVQSPQDYQVFQRHTRLDGQVFLSGRVHVPCDRLEVRLSGKSLKGGLPDTWQAVALAPKTHAFEHKLPVAAGGWYRVEVRASKGAEVVAQKAVEHVGVGEVFVGAGQSNSTNCGQEKIKQNSGMVSSFSGYSWQLADDPQPGVHDHTKGGSYWPAFGDAMYARYGVPIGVASTGHSGTSVNAWQPGGELFRWMMTRIYQLGPKGFRALQWHQGESDVGMSTNEYVRRLTAVIQTSQRAAGWEFPWFVARVSYHNPEKAAFPTTRDAQKMLWDSGVALEGPDTDQLGSDNRDDNGKGIHFSPKGLQAHGRMWVEKIAVYLDRVLEGAQGQPANAKLH